MSEANQWVRLPMWNKVIRTVSKHKIPDKKVPDARTEEKWKQNGLEIGSKHQPLRHWHPKLDLKADKSNFDHDNKTIIEF